jgi:hypothetical protein
MSKNQSGENIALNWLITDVKYGPINRHKKTPLTGRFCSSYEFQQLAIHVRPVTTSVVPVPDAVVVVVS